MSRGWVGRSAYPRTRPLLDITCISGVEQRAPEHPSGVRQFVPTTLSTATRRCSRTLIGDNPASSCNWASRTTAATSNSRSFTSSNSFLVITSSSSATPSCSPRRRASNARWRQLRRQYFGFRPTRSAGRSGNGREHHSHLDRFPDPLRFVTVTKLRGCACARQGPPDSGQFSSADQDRTDLGEID